MKRRNTSPTAFAGAPKRLHFPAGVMVGVARGGEGGLGSDRGEQLGEEQRTVTSGRGGLQKAPATRSSGARRAQDEEKRLQRRTSAAILGGRVLVS